MVGVACEMIAELQGHLDTQCIKVSVEHQLQAGEVHAAAAAALSWVASQLAGVMSVAYYVALPVAFWGLGCTHSDACAGAHQHTKDQGPSSSCYMQCPEPKQLQQCVHLGCASNCNTVRC